MSKIEAFSFGICAGMLFIIGVLLLGRRILQRIERQQDLIAEILQGFDREAYGLEIHDELRRRGESMSLGTMYCALADLEDDGRITSRFGEGTPDRGGRRKKYFAVREGL